VIPGTPDLPPPGGRIIGKNLVVVGVLYAIRAAAGFAALAYLGRTLGGRVFGIYIAALSLVTIVQALEELGGTDYLVREGTRDPARMERLLADVLFLKAATTALLLAVAIGAAAVMGFDPTELAVVALLVAREGAEAVSDALRAPLKAIERMEAATATAIAVTVASSAALIAGVAAGWGLVGAVGASAAAAAAGIPLSWAITRRFVRVRVRASFRDALGVARRSFPFAVVEILSFATTYADTLVIRIALGRTATGLYGGGDL
jgi:O-antigen/teichoic acid export membrane protein